MLDVIHRLTSRRNCLRAIFALPCGLATRQLPAAVRRESPKARSVILLWLWGGPSQLDTFDPKPHAPSEVRGPFSAIQTRTPGVLFSELFPRLAARSDRFSLLRSNVTLDNAHHIAGSIALSGQRGRSGDNDYQPNFGAVVQRAHQGSRDLPKFISIGEGILDTAAGNLKATGGGVWGTGYDPFLVRCSELGGVELPGLQLPPGLEPQQLARRQQLTRQLDGFRPPSDSQATQQWSRHAERALALLTSPAGRRAFDLNTESSQTLAAYGNTQFGHSCLLARKLVEAEVPYIQVNWSQWVENIYDGRTDFGWDTHWLNFEHLADRHGPIFDRACSALLDDLQQRNLLESTLVIALGEFGRTPKISSNGGRDHWIRCYSSLWAGGGVQPGRVVGESDRTASDPVTPPVFPADVGVTMLELAGVTTEQRAEMRVLPQGRFIDALVS